MLNKDTIVLEKGNDTLFYRISATNLDKRTKVVVPDTHYAIIIKDGKLMDTLNGGAHALFDPKSESKCKSVQVEVIYLSKTYRLQVGWGTRKRFSFRDSETDILVAAGANGKFEVQISNPRKAYLELIGAEKEFNAEALQERLLSRILDKISAEITLLISKGGLSVSDLARHRTELQEKVSEKLLPIFTDEYGLKLFSFTIDEIKVFDEFIEAVESERRLIKEKRESEIAKREEKFDAEIDDQKKWDRVKYLMELRRTNYEKYLEVCKEIGWEPKSRIDKNSGSVFCPQCGAECDEKDRFCRECGKEIKSAPKVCPECGKENPSGSKFCGDCGKKL